MATCSVVPYRFFCVLSFVVTVISFDRPSTYIRGPHTCAAAIGSCDPLCYLKLAAGHYVVCPVSSPISVDVFRESLEHFTRYIEPHTHQHVHCHATGRSKQPMKFKKTRTTWMNRIFLSHFHLNPFIKNANITVHSKGYSIKLIEWEIISRNIQV
jgi:hypothetical protein